MGLLVAVVIALAAGIVGTYLILRSRMAVSVERIRNLEQRLDESCRESQRLTAELGAKTASLLATSNELSATRAELSAEREAAAEKLSLVQQTEQRLSESFDLLAARALKENTAEFLKLAKNQFDHEQKMASGDLSVKKEAIETLLQTASS